MKQATRNDIIRLFPDIQDHAVLEILTTGAEIDELTAAQLVMQDDDEAIQALKARRGDRLHRIVDILNAANVVTGDEKER